MGDMSKINTKQTREMVLTEDRKYEVKNLASVEKGGDAEYDKIN